MRIVIFTLDNCYYCQELKDKLNTQSIPFVNLEISKNQEFWDNIVEHSGDDTIPTVFIVDDDGRGVIYTAGKDFQSNDEIIEIIKSKI